METSLQHFAVIGASVRLQELLNERVAIEEFLATLTNGETPAGHERLQAAATSPAWKNGARKKATQTFSAEQRAAVSRRMRAYWKARRTHAHA
jgi:uncharacterized protein YciW